MAWARFLLLLIAALAGAAAAEDARIADLVRRREGSSDGVVSLDDASVRQLVASADRPYALLVFFDAQQIREQRSELRLDELRSEFALVAQAFNKNNEEGSKNKLFFCSLNFEQSQASFASFGVKSLPHVRYVAPGSSPLSAAESIDMNDASTRSAEGLTALVESRTRLRVGQIQRPPPLSKQQVLLAAAAAIAVAPLLLRKLVLAQDSVLRDRRLWCAGAISVYFFSVSGGMHNIIRKMPLFMPDRRDASKIMFFYQGSGVQLGAEGFAIGLLYTLVGLLLAIVTHLLPAAAASSATLQRLLMFLSMSLAFWSATRVVSLDNWKTGYAVHAYLPKSWR